MSERASMEQLVREAKQGSDRAQVEILEGFKPLLIKNIIQYFGRNQDFDDWLQEGRVILLQKIKEYNEELGVPFAAYVQKQIFYYYINERKKTREEVILDQPLPDGRGSLADLFADDTAQVEEIITSQEDRQYLYQALDSLSSKQREVLISYYVKEKKLKELAKKENLCYQALVKRKARALEGVRIEIEKNHGLLSPPFSIYVV